jgi:predicted transport protein
MGQEPELQTRLYEQYWRRIEIDFGQNAYSTHFDAFMRHYLTVKTGEIPNVREVYQAFKDYARSHQMPTEDLVADIRAFAGHFCAMALGAEIDGALKTAFQDLRELKVDVAYPFLLELYHDYDSGALSHDELLKVVRLVESYVFRRAVCAIPTNSMNKTFSMFGRDLKKDRYVERILAHFLLLPSYRRFPSDEEFGREIKVRALYSFRSRTYWLRRLENHERKEPVSVDEFTIEHILPQNENLSAQWKADLGPEWESVQKTYLHTLGNLTLTGYNSEYSDHPFSEKRDSVGGFKESPIRLNQGLGQLTSWNEEEIVRRAAKLAKQAVSVWTGPQLDPSVLEAYKPTSVTTGYAIDDHPNLLHGPTRDLFEAFRKEVLALDPAVTEEFLKLYVAYKAETNFVDAVPLVRGLRLTLNLRFHEIEDPRAVCRDVSGLGRWGNGDVEVMLTSTEDLPYVVGLVRQSLEKQMGNGGDA